MEKPFSRRTPMTITNELYKDLNKHFANQDPQNLTPDLLQTYANLLTEISKELKNNHYPNSEEYEVFLKVSTGAYKDTFISTLQKFDAEDRKSFVANLSRVNSSRQEEQKNQQMINALADMLKSVPARLEAIENIENTIKNDNLNPVIKTLMVEMLKDKDLKEQLDEKKLASILKIGTELSENHQDTKSLSEQFIDRLIADKVLDKDIEDKLLEITMNTENNESQIIADDAQKKQQEEADRLKREEAENKARALKELKDNANDDNINPVVRNFFNEVLNNDTLTQNFTSLELNRLNNLKNIDKDLDESNTIYNLDMYIRTSKELDGFRSDLLNISSDVEKPIVLKELEDNTNNKDLNPIVKEFFNNILKDDELKKDLSTEDIKEINNLRFIDKSMNEFDTIDQIKYDMSLALNSKILDVIVDMEEAHQATQEERNHVLDTINQFTYNNPPKIQPKTAYALLTCDDPNTALINVDDLYAVGQTINKDNSKLPEDAADIFQDVLKTRLSGLREGDILPSNAKAYLELCSQCEDSSVASAARNLIADALVKYDKSHFGALNPDPDDLASVYNYAKDTLEKIDVFELPARPNEPDLSKLELLDEQGNPLSKKETEALRKSLNDMAREMTAREVVARKGNISTDELNQIYKASVTQILMNAKPDAQKLQNNKVYAVKATDLAHSLAVQTNKMEEFNVRAKQKFKNHPWVKALTASAKAIDKNLENNKTIGKAYKTAKPVLKFLGKTAVMSAKTATIFGVAGLVPGGTGILLAYYGGKNIKQAANAIVDKDLNWKQKIGKVTFHSVSAALSLVGAAQGLEAGAEMLKNAGFEGLSNVMQGAGEIINKGVGLAGQGLTAIVAHTANLLPGVQGFHSIPAETISSTLSSLSSAGRFAIMGSMMAAPNVLKGTKMKLKSWSLKRKIKKEKDPIKLQALNILQQNLHDEQIKNLQDMTLKLGSSALGMFISSKLTPLVGELMHNTTSHVVEGAKATAKTIEISLDGNNSQSEHQLSQAELQQQEQAEGHKGHMAAPREDPEANQSNTTQHKATNATTHTNTTTTHTGNAHTGDAHVSSTGGNDASTGTSSQAQTFVSSGNATLDALKAAGVEGLELINDADGNPSIKVAQTQTIDTSAQTGTSTQTSTVVQPKEETVLVMDELTGAMIEVPAEPEKTVSMDEETGELRENPVNQETSARTSTKNVTAESVQIIIDQDGMHEVKADTTNASDIKSDESTAQQVAGNTSEAKHIKVLGFDGKEIPIPTNRADAPESITLYQGFDEVNNYNINHATKDGILTPATYNELKAQGITSVEQLRTYFESHPDALTHTVSTNAAQTTVSTTVNASTNTTINVSTQGTSSETMTQTITLPDGSTAERVAPTNKSTITVDGSSTTFSTRTDVKLTGDTVVDYLNLTQARDGDNGTGKPQGFQFERTGNTTTQVVQEQEVVENIVPPVEVIMDPYAEVDNLLATGRYVLDESLNRDLNPHTQFILRDRFANPHDNYTCLVIETEPHDDGTGRLTCISEYDHATLFARKTGGDNEIFCSDERISHSVHVRHGIGIPTRSPDIVDKVFNTIDSGVRLFGATVHLAHSVANLFSGGHHHHDAPPPPPHRHGGRPI